MILKIFQAYFLATYRKTLLDEIVMEGGFDSLVHVKSSLSPFSRGVM